MTRPRMIYHVPYPLVMGTSASGIRPTRMRRAFEDIGFDVVEISGVSRDRARRIRELGRRIRAGERFAFVYSESATMPAFMTDPDHLPRHPLVDARFFRLCRKHGIPVGLFYRDVYWRFPIYDEAVRQPLSTVMRALYRWELRQYRDAGLTLYLPSLEMARWVPILPRERMRALPPGGDARQEDPARYGSTRDDGAPIRLLYVGGLGSNYRMHETVREIAGRDDVELTICTREGEWAGHRDEYASILAPNIRVVHRSGDELDELYAEADVALLAVQPIVYWEFAVPMKLMEYIGAGMPVLASAGTHSADIVERLDAGWVVRYGSGELGELLARLHRQPEEIARVGRQVREIRDTQTWEARARQVAEELPEIGA